MLAEAAREKEQERKMTFQRFEKSSMPEIHAAAQAATIVGTICSIALAPLIVRASWAPAMIRQIELAHRSPAGALAAPIIARGRLHVVMPSQGGHRRNVSAGVE